MFLNFKFSIFDSYKTSLRVNYKNILFYLSWYVITVTIGFVVFFGLGIYSDILNISAMTQNYAWIVPFVKHQLTAFFMGFKYSDIEFTGLSFYDLLKLFISKDILNHSLQTMSLKEYFNVVLLPKKIVLIPFFMIWISFVMTVSIGYIKTALKFQSSKKATLYDIYQYIYLLPQYILGKIIMYLLCFICFFLYLVIGFFVLGLNDLTVKQNTPIGLVLIGVIFIVMVVLAIFVYQRLRFMKYFIIDKEVSAFKAVQLSWDVTRGSVISLFLFSLVAGLIGVVHPMSGLFIMLAGWLNQQAEVNLYRQMMGLEK